MSRVPGLIRLSSRAGMALVSVLLITVVMLGLAGAFFLAHKSDLALMTSGHDREQTKNACVSLADFVQYKLQNDRKFGMQAFSSNGSLPAQETFPDTGDPLLTVGYYGEKSNLNPTSGVRNFLRGTMPESGVEFEIEILNNLDGAFPLSVTSLRTAPPRSCRAWISSRRGNITQNIDLILKRTPFTNSSIIAGKNITVQLTDAQGGAWTLGARQPSGNAVRAGGRIRGPEVWSKTGKAVSFTPPPGMERKLNPPYGVLQGETLSMQVDGVYRNLSSGTDVVRESEKNIRGALSPGGGELRIPKLNTEDLQSVTSKIELPESKLTFQATVGESGQTIHQLVGSKGIIASYDPKTQPPRERHFSWSEPGLSDAVEIDLESRVMKVAPNVELTTGSDSFSLSSVTADGTLDPTQQPTLFLGSGDYGAALEASNIRIEGSVGGKGALKSHNDLQIAAKSYLSTTPDFGIALHAKRDIVLTKPETNSRDGLAVDWEAFSQGYKAGADNKKLNSWMEITPSEREAAAASFKGRTLAESSNPAAFDAIWAGLTADFPADEHALAAREEWLKPGVPPVMGEDPNWQPSQPEPHPGFEPDPGLEPDPGIDPGDTPVTEPEKAPIIELTPGIPAGPGIDIDKYVRLREYLRTVKSGQPDPSWLATDDHALASQRRRDVTNLVGNQLSAYQLAAGQTSKEVQGEVVLEWLPLGSYFQSDSNPNLASYTPDMVFRGLIYAGRNFVFDTEKKGIYIEGALVANDNVQIKNATGANFVYNSELLENLFAPDEEDTSALLKRSYWAYY